MRTWERVVAALYVGAVAALAASAFWTPDATFTWSREGVAMLLTLPALLFALPVIYLVGAGLWSVTDAGSGGPMWPVTAGYALMFAGVALANVWLLRGVRGRRQTRARPAPPAGLSA